MNTHNASPGLTADVEPSINKHPELRFVTDDGLLSARAGAVADAMLSDLYYDPKTKGYTSDSGFTADPSFEDLKREISSEPDERKKQFEEQLQAMLARVETDAEGIEFSPVVRALCVLTQEQYNLWDDIPRGEREALEEKLLGYLVEALGEEVEEKVEAPDSVDHDNIDIVPVERELLEELQRWHRENDISMTYYESGKSIGAKRKEKNTYIQKLSDLLSIFKRAQATEADYETDILSAEQKTEMVEVLRKLKRLKINELEESDDNAPTKVIAESGTIAHALRDRTYYHATVDKGVLMLTRDNGVSYFKNIGDGSVAMSPDTLSNETRLFINDLYTSEESQKELLKTYERMGSGQWQGIQLSIIPVIRGGQSEFDVDVNIEGSRPSDFSNIDDEKVVSLFSGYALEHVVVPKGYKVETGDRDKLGGLLNALLNEFTRGASPEKKESIRVAFQDRTSGEFDGRIPLEYLVNAIFSNRT